MTSKQIFNILYDERNRPTKVQRQARQPADIHRQNVLRLRHSSAHRCECSHIDGQANEKPFKNCYRLYEKYANKINTGCHAVTAHTAYVEQRANKLWEVLYPLIRR
jgi:hypothetical protein